METRGYRENFLERLHGIERNHRPLSAAFPAPFGNFSEVKRLSLRPCQNTPQIVSHSCKTRCNGTDMEVGSLQSDISNQFPGGVSTVSICRLAKLEEFTTLQEATRIQTPPLDEDTADGRARGFFTSTSLPTVDGSGHSASESSTRSKRRSPRSEMHRRCMSGQTREWWERVPKRPVRRNPVDRVRAFEFDIPEHLPSSPLCPANKRHNGGGSGVCVYHGRKKVPSMLKEEFVPSERYC